MAASIKFLISTRPCRTSASSANSIAHGPTVAITELKKAMAGPSTGASVPKEKMINAPQITVSARHRPAMEPRMIVKPVTMSAADFRRLPNGSRAHCSALSRLAPPESTMLNPLSTPWSETVGSIKPRMRFALMSGQLMSDTDWNRLPNVSWTAMPILSAASSWSKWPPDN